MKWLVEEAMKQLYLHFARMGNLQFFRICFRRSRIHHAVFAAEQEKGGHAELREKLGQ